MSALVWMFWEQEGDGLDESGVVVTIDTPRGAGGIWKTLRRRLFRR